MTTDAIYKERGSDWLHQVSTVGTTQWLQCDHTLPLSAKGVACETNFSHSEPQSGVHHFNKLLKYSPCMSCKNIETEGVFLLQLFSFVLS